MSRFHFPKGRHIACPYDCFHRALGFSQGQSLVVARYGIWSQTGKYLGNKAIRQ